MSKVLGVGWAKTGTTTLGACLRELGYDHSSHAFHLVGKMRPRDIKRAMAFAETKDSFEDWPWLLLYKEFDQAFPGSKFILTTRKEEKWIQSYRNMVAKEGPVSRSKNAMRSALYGLPFPNVTDEQLLERYRKHTEDVKAYFADRPDDLLVVRWAGGDGWTEICEFLGKPVPDKPFPHKNKGAYGKAAPAPTPPPQRSLLQKVKDKVFG